MTRGSPYVIPDLDAPSWAGLLDAGGVLAVLLVWLALGDATTRVRAAAGVSGGVLLVLAAGRAVERVSVVGFSAAVPGGLTGSNRSWLEVGLGLAGLAAGAVAATLHAHHVALVDDDPAAPADLPPLPASVWSRTEVIGDAPEHDGEVEPAPLPRPAQRGVAVPLLAVAAGIGLPVFSTLSSIERSFPIGFGGSSLHWYAIARHVLAGVLAGLAVLGAAVALDVWERRLGVVAFVLAAVGIGANTGWPRTFLNEYWTFAAIGLAAGLLAPATLAAVRRATGVDRRAVLAGVAAAFLLLGVSAYVGGRAFVEQRESQVDF